jgi:hypothetical protein
MDSAAILNLGGLTDLEALVAPPPGGNWVNWQVGHFRFTPGRVHAPGEAGLSWRLLGTAGAIA